MELRESILEGAICAFKEKGLKFTMDDVAHQLNISKKTIYTVYKDKEALYLAMVDFLFDSIKESEQKVLEDESLSTVDKIRRIMGVMPDGYLEFDFHELYELRDKYPLIYHRVEKRLETGWEATIELIHKGMEEGVIRPVKIPILKMMMESALEQFFQRDILIRNHISYNDGLKEIVEILTDGIVVKNE